MSTISAGKLIANSLIHLGDTTGALVFQTNGSTTALTLDSAQSAAFTSDVSVGGALTVNDSATITGALSLGGTLTLDGTIITSTAAELNYNDITALGTSEANKVVTADSNGDVILSEELIAKSYNETYVEVTSTSNATSVNCEAGNTFMHRLTENTTFTFNNPPASGTGYTMSIEIIQDDSASGYAITWPASVDFPAATAPSLTPLPSAVDVFVFTTRDAGTNWYGFTAGLNIATPT